jgi:hypothetical protein
MFSNEHYFEYAQKCLKIATEFYATNNPKLIPYELCFGEKIFKDLKSVSI